MTRGILNTGSGAWAFEEHARALAEALWVETSTSPFDCNFLLAWESHQPPPGKCFIPFEGIRIAADKRLQAEVFRQSKVSTPETYLFDDKEKVADLIRRESSRKWVLKFPESCGGAGHSLLEPDVGIPLNWPKPYVVQEFIRLEQPEVYRLYCVSGELFGWNARRFPAGTKASPWVAHARGARYVHLGNPPPEARTVATDALNAAGLFKSFGVVDLLPSARGWLALEIGTDGLFNHVDREVDSPELTDEIDRRLAEAFWRDTEKKPWGEGAWRRRTITAAVPKASSI